MSNWNLKIDQDLINVYKAIYTTSTCAVHMQEENLSSQDHVHFSMEACRIKLAVWVHIRLTGNMQAYRKSSACFCCNLIKTIYFVCIFLCSVTQCNLLQINGHAMQSCWCTCTPSSIKFILHKMPAQYVLWGKTTKETT